MIKYYEWRDIKNIAIIVSIISALLMFFGFIKWWAIPAFGVPSLLSFLISLKARREMLNLLLRKDEEQKNEH